MKKQGVRFWARAFLCVFVFLSLFQYGAWVVREKNDETMTGFYLEEKNTIDVAFVGSSHVYMDINPTVIWNREGIASYNMGSAAQPMWLSYHYIRELCRTQKPKVVVVEVLSVMRHEDAYDPVESVYYLKGLQALSPVARVRAIHDIMVDPGDRMQFYFDIIQYHGVLPDAGRLNFSGGPKFSLEARGEKNVRQQPSWLKGYAFDADVKKAAVKPVDTEGIKEVTPLSPRHVEYLDKILSLSREKGFAVLFIKSPYINNKVSMKPEVQKRIYNGMRAYAADRGVPFLDFNQPGMDCGIDWSTDTNDGGWHLNAAGAEKYTAALGEYLKKNYKLTDHHGDPLYASFHEAYNQYFCLKRDAALAAEQDPAAYFEKLRQGEYVAVFAVRGKGGALPSEVRRCAGAFGLALDCEGTESYLAVVKGGEVLYEKSGAQRLSYFYEEDGLRLHAVSVGSGARAEETDGEKPAAAARILIDCEEYAKNREGINIVVYDTATRQVADSCWIAPAANAKISR